MTFILQLPAHTCFCRPHTIGAGKDNKNYALLAYLGFLLVQDMIDHASVHYLLVGHTHNDVDGIFGR
jgi:hypothetical protein